MSLPLQYDVHVSACQGKVLGQHPLFDLVVQSGIAHGLLAGFWYAAALFISGSKAQVQGAEWVRTCVLTVFAGRELRLLFRRWPQSSSRGRHHARQSSAPVSRTIRRVISIPIPSPSFSTAIYTVVALGVYSLDRITGTLLLLGIPLLIALPRIYVGGHYPTDVLSGCVIGVVGFVVARSVLERRIIRPIVSLFENCRWSRALREMLVFIAIWQVAVEFNEVAWVQRAIPVLLKHR